MDGPRFLSRPRTGPAPFITCRHCQKLRKAFKRGMCNQCYKEPGVKDQYPLEPRTKRVRAPRPIVVYPPPADPDGVLAALAGVPSYGLVVVWNIDPEKGVRLVGYDAGIRSAGGDVRFVLQFPSKDPDRSYVESLILGVVKRAARAQARRRADGGDVAE